MSLENIYTSIQDKFAIFVGILFGLSLAFYTILFIPLSLFFFFIKYLAKYLRPDLCEIITGISAVFCCDYFSKRPPRSNIVLTLSFEGNLTLPKVKHRVLEKWIHAKNPATGNLIFDKFQKYPVRWMGFNFWKEDAEFCIDNHIVAWRNNNNSITSESELSTLVETLLNRQFPVNKSPWQIYVIENYKSKNKGSRKSVLIFNVHHCLTDGTGVFLAVQALEKHATKETHGDKHVNSRLQQRSLSQQISMWLHFPVVAYHIFSRLFQNCSWVVPDSRKAWHQVYAKSQPIPIQCIKDVKTKAGVSFTSVLVAAFSSAVQRACTTGSESNRKSLDRDLMMCATMLPLPDRLAKSVLYNHYAFFVFDLPVHDKLSGEDRLREIDKAVKTMASSSFPIISDTITKLTGIQFSGLIGMASKTKGLPLGFSNFSVIDKTFIFDENTRLVNADFVVGAFRGETGICVSVLSFGEEVIVNVCCEKALMSKKQTEQFVMYIYEELTKQKL